MHVALKDDRWLDLAGEVVSFFDARIEQHRPAP
jgi:hypothetical protein